MKFAESLVNAVADSSLVPMSNIPIPNVWTLAKRTKAAVGFHTMKSTSSARIIPLVPSSMVCKGRDFLLFKKFGQELCLSFCEQLFEGAANLGT